MLLPSWRSVCTANIRNTGDTCVCSTKPVAFVPQWLAIAINAPGTQRLLKPSHTLRFLMLRKSVGIRKKMPASERSNVVLELNHPAYASWANWALVISLPSTSQTRTLSRAYVKRGSATTLTCIGRASRSFLLQTRKTVYHPFSYPERFKRR